MENNDEFDDTPLIYTACQGCPHDTQDGICDVPGPCQAYPNAELYDTAPEVTAPVEMLMLPAATLTTPDNGRLFA